MFYVFLYDKFYIQCITFLFILVFTMRSVVSVRVPPELKKKMDEFKSQVNWSKEIREFIRRKVEELEKKRVVEDVVEFIKTLPPAPKGTAEKLVREDRDSH